MILVSLPIILNPIIPSDSHLALTYVIVLFFLYFACIYLSIKYKVGNEKIYTNFEAISVIDFEKSL